MLPENKLFFNSDDVLFVFWIVCAELLEDFGLNQPLFVKAFFVSQNLAGDYFVCFVVEALENLAK